MFRKYVFLLFISISLFFSDNLYSQEKNTDTISGSGDVNNDNVLLQNPSDSAWKTCTSPFIELLGKGFLSINVDFRWKESHAISVGLISEGLAPNIMYYYLSGKRHRFEVGGGFTLGFSSELKPATFLIHGVIGYRYQKKKGVFFRIGVTPLYVIMFDDPENSNKLYPFPGLSLGYSF